MYLCFRDRKGTSEAMVAQENSSNGFLLKIATPTSTADLNMMHIILITHVPNCILCPLDCFTKRLLSSSCHYSVVTDILHNLIHFTTLFSEKHLTGNLETSLFLQVMFYEKDCFTTICRQVYTATEEALQFHRLREFGCRIVNL